MGADSRREGRRRRAASVSLAFAFASLALTITPHTAEAEESSRAPDLVFVGDPNLGMEGTVRTLMSTGRLLRRYEELLPSVPGDDAGTRFIRGFGAGLRLLFLDFPFAEVETTVIHEVAGHGARGREFGKSPSFSFKLPSLYRALFSPGDEERSFARRRDAVVRSGDATTGSVLGGVESDYLTAHWTNLQMVASGGQLHAIDSLVYVASKISYLSDYVGTNLAEPGEDSGNDLTAYVDELSNRWNRFRPADRRALAKRLQTAYVWNLVDPALAWAWWSTFVETLGRGRRVSTAPLPTIAGYTTYLGPRFALSPFGAEHYLDAFASPAPRVDDANDANDARSSPARWVANAYVRVGSSGLATYVGAGMKVLDVPVARNVRLGGELDVFRQPVLDWSARAYYDRPDTFGANGAAYASLTLTRGVSVTGKLGYKSTGFVMGLPLGDGPHGYLGFALTP